MGIMCLGVASIAYVGRQVHSLELPLDSAVNSIGFSPTSTELEISVWYQYSLRPENGSIFIIFENKLSVEETKHADF